MGFVGIGGTAGVEQLAAVHPLLALVALVPVLLVLGSSIVGVILLWAAVLMRPRVHPLSVLVVLALSVGSLLVAIWPLALLWVEELAYALILIGILLLMVGAVGALIVWGATPTDKKQWSTREPHGPRLGSIGVVVAASLAMVGVIVLGLLDGLVWGVEHQAGGLPATAVYAALSDLDRASGIVSVVVWAAVWSLGPVVLVVVRHWSLRRGASDHDVARVVGVLGFLGVGAIVFFQGWATFSIGMSIADTLPPYTGSRSPFWSAYASLGAVFGFVGLLLALAPPRGSGASPRALRAEPLRVN